MATDDVTQFVLDAIDVLEPLGAQQDVDFLRMMLECDGPDIDGAVSALVAYDAVTQEWVDRLTLINEESLHFFDEELAELREGLENKPTAA